MMQYVCGDQIWGHKECFCWRNRKSQQLYTHKMKGWAECKSPTDWTASQTCQPQQWIQNTTSCFLLRCPGLTVRWSQSCLKQRAVTGWREAAASAETFASGDVPFAVIICNHFTLENPYGVWKSQNSKNGLTIDHCQGLATSQNKSCAKSAPLPGCFTKWSELYACKSLHLVITSLIYNLGCAMSRQWGLLQHVVFDLTYSKFVRCRKDTRPARYNGTYLPIYIYKLENIYVCKLLCI